MLKARSWKHFYLLLFRIIWECFHRRLSSSCHSYGLYWMLIQSWNVFISNVRSGYILLNIVHKNSITFYYFYPPLSWKPSFSWDIIKCKALAGVDERVSLADTQAYSFICILCLCQGARYFPNDPRRWPARHPLSSSVRLRILGDNKHYKLTL